MKKLKSFAVGFALGLGILVLGYEVVVRGAVVYTSASNANFLANMPNEEDYPDLRLCDRVYRANRPVTPDSIRCKAAVEKYKNDMVEYTGG